MDFAFSFIIRNGGLDTEKDYKYKAADGVCNINKEKKHVVTIDSYEDVPPNDEGALKKVTRAANSQLQDYIKTTFTHFVVNESRCYLLKAWHWAYQPRKGRVSIFG